MNLNFEEFMASLEVAGEETDYKWKHLTPVIRVEDKVYFINIVRVDGTEVSIETGLRAYMLEKKYA